MTDLSIESQGFELFISLDGTTVLKFDCPTAIEGIGFSTSERSNTCLDSANETARPGRKKINPFSVPFLMQAGSTGQEYILDGTDNAAAEIPYCIAWSDGTSDPTLSGGAFVAPGGGTPTRTITHGTGYISALNWGAAENELIRGSFTFSPLTQIYVYKA